MKNYFGFTLTGKTLLPIWILYLLLFLAPYLILTVSMKSMQQNSNISLLFLPLFLVLLFISFIITFYIVKLAIGSISFNEKTIVFNGKFSEYISVVLFGLFISVITLGIYVAWFVRDLHAFFIDNSSFDLEKLKFRGKGGKLFVILLLTLMLPVFILSVTLAVFIIKNGSPYKYGMIIQQMLIMILMIPYLYFIYKWMVNISFKNYTISWHTDVWSSIGKIALEMFFTIITLGIYMPLAMLRLYKYFTDRTLAVSDERKLNFGYDIDQLNDFLFIWGQTLLSIVTLGIYYPWAFCKIGNRILSKTYVAELSAVKLIFKNGDEVELA
jgi:uncharacterized membrane protein YjgN (DUF898 family)